MKLRVLHALKLLVFTLAVNIINYQTAEARTADFMVDGIFYYKNDDGVSVTVTNRSVYHDEAYIGDIQIPPTVFYSDVNYSVVAIEDGTFSGCTGVTSVSIPNTINKIGSNAFSGTKITSIIIPNSVSSIGDGICSNCKQLKDINLPSDINSIGNKWFYGCTGLETIDFMPHTVSSIGQEAFNNCSGLINIVLPNTINTIGEKAFYNCSGLQNLTISKSVTSIKRGAFAECKKLKNLIFNADNCEDYEHEYGYAFPIYPIFENCPIETLLIGDNVKRVPAFLLYSSSSNVPLTLTIGESVEYIAQYAFSGKTIPTLTIPKSVLGIDDEAFSGCKITELVWNAINCSAINGNSDYYNHTKNVQSVIIGDEVQVIPNYFVSMSQIQSVDIPESVTKIGSAAFRDCTGLTSVIIPNSVTEIGYYTFKGCTGLTSISIPGSFTSFGTEIFSDCTGLIDINFSNSLTIIGTRWFSGCIGLESVSIPNSVKTIGQYAFSGCTGLVDVSIPNSVINIYDNAFDGCTALTKVNISSLESWCYINFSSFKANPLYYAQHLYLNDNEVQDMIIPNTITSIGQYAFSGCSGLTSVIIPNSVTSIGQYAFSGCTGLNYVILLKSKSPYCNSTMFPSRQLIYVPNASNYNSYGWNTYNIQGIYTIEPQITRAIISSSDLFPLVTVILIDSEDQTIQTINANDNSALITDLYPNSTNKIIVSFLHDGNNYDIDDTFSTNTLSITQHTLELATQTTLTTCFTVNRDEGFILEACGVESNNDSYNGEVIDTTNDTYTIKCHINGLTPNNSYSFRPWVQYKGEKYYGNNKTFKTSAIDVNNEVTVTPTSVYLTGSYLSGDADVIDAYFTFNGENMKTLYRTGLNPSTTYSYTYTVETTSGNQVNNYSFYTPALSMVAHPVKMLTNTTVLFEAETNMIDEETMVGFEWRRYDAPNEMPSTQVYSPVFGGKIAGTLKNLSENVYYKYRPFYTSNSGKSYYGNWVAFLTADAGVEYEPMVYTYNSPKVTQTDATLEGVALQGSDEITEQGFEYWKSGNSNIIKVTATGERMSKKISSLQSGTKYTFRAFLLAGGETHYGNEVEFVTLSNSLDVNLDGEINIADINMIIDIILTGKPGVTCDTNGDGEVNIADINTVIDAILSH